MSHSKYAMMLILMLSSGACDQGTITDNDAGSDDAGSGDAGPLEVTDAGPLEVTDAGPEDGGAQDAGPVDPDAGPPVLEGCQGPPGLFVSGTTTCSALEEGLESFQPQFPLWTDGARKERFAYLPINSTIDTSEPDSWSFPVGTRIYKNFYIGDLRVETRMSEKISEGRGFLGWQLRTFAWNEDQLTVEELEIGRANVLGTDHDIPSHPQCVRCHSIAVSETAVGFSAIQLNHDLGGLNLASLNSEGRLLPPISLEDARIPGDAQERQALGTLHANCGHCHGGRSPTAGMDLWVDVGLDAPEDTGAMRTTVGIGTAWRVGVDRITPGSAETSAIVIRMGTRDLGVDQMPPIGSDLMDPQGIAAVSAWIDSLAD